MLRGLRIQGSMVGKSSIPTHAMEDTMKRCNVCNQVKDLKEFYRDKSRVDGRKYVCKDCSNKYSIAYAKKRYHDDGDFAAKGRERSRAHRSTPVGRFDKYMAQCYAKYGVREEQIRELLDKQKGGCAICGVDFGEVQLHDRRRAAYDIDHCHTTGQVRGLLCTTCNKSVGVYETWYAQNRSSIHNYLE